MLQTTRGGERQARPRANRRDAIGVEQVRCIRDTTVIGEAARNRWGNDVSEGQWGMAILEIVLEGDPRLRQKATKIRGVDDSLRRLAADMHETMLDAPGVGLAAPQIGVSRRLIVVHVPAGHEHDDDPEINLALANPEIVRSGGRQVGPEGCLSIPGWVGDVPRADAITVKALDMTNKDIRIKAKGYLSRVIQHEIDHLDGILFVDRIEDKDSLRRVEDDEDVDPDPDMDDADFEDAGAARREPAYSSTGG